MEGDTVTYAPPPITGYRSLTQLDVDVINELKALAETVGKKVELLQSCGAYDGRWLAIGKTDLQTGFMALIRGVAKPETF